MLLAIAWRNLWRNSRRTAIMLAAIAIGVWAMIVMPAFMRGMIDNMVAGTTENFLGHIQIHHENYRQDPVIDHSLPLPQGELLAALEQEGLWTPRLRLPAIISSEYETRAVTLLGVDPDRESEMSFVAESITAGEYFASARDGGLVIGARLAERLDTSLGKRVVLMVQGADNEMLDRGIRISGIFRSDLPMLEEQFVLMTLPQAQQLLDVRDRITEIEWHGADYRTIAPMLTKLQQAAPNATVSPWYALDPMTGSMMDFIDGFVLVWVLIIFVALSFGLVNTLAMSVYERVREFGLIQALGVKPQGVVLLVMYEAILLLLLGVLLGNALTTMTLWLWGDGVEFEMLTEGFSAVGVSPVLQLSPAPGDMLLANAVVLLLGAAATAIPAAQATRFDPVIALNKD